MSVFCKDRVNVNDNGNDNVNVNDNDNVNGNVNENDNGNVNSNVNVNDNGNVIDNVNGAANVNVHNNGNSSVNINGNDNVNDKQRTPLSDDGTAWSETHSDDDDDDIIFSITKQRDKPNSLCRCGKVSNVGDKSRGNPLSQKTSGLVGDKSRGNPLSPINEGSNLLIDVNDSLQSWLNNPNINVAAIFPENFRCIISGPSECGKTLLLKNLILNGVDFDKLYIIGPTGNQYNDLEFDDVVFNKDIKELPSPDKLPKNLKN